MNKILKIRPECRDCISFRGDTPMNAECTRGLDPTCYRKKKPCEKRMAPVPSTTAGAIAYVDGSFNSETETWGWGLVLVIGDKKEVFSGSGRENADGRQVMGELTAALAACEKALERSARSLEIRYDYEGIARWALGEWRANKPYTKAYARDMEIWGDLIPLCFCHVTAHSGDVENERADALAKEACGLKAVSGHSGYVPRIPEDVFPKCRDAIRAFYEDPDPTFKAYLRLKTYGRDPYSEMGLQSLIDAAGKDAADVAADAFSPRTDTKSYMSALRWILRGLRAEDAIRKVTVDSEAAENRRDNN